MRFLKFFTIFYLLFFAKASALIEIDITRGNLDPLPIAVSPLFQDKPTKDKSQKKLNKSK